MDYAGLIGVESEKFVLTYSKIILGGCSQAKSL